MRILHSSELLQWDVSGVFSLSSSSEAYIKYGERATEKKNGIGAQNIGRVLGSAQKQADMVQGF